MWHLFMLLIETLKEMISWIFVLITLILQFPLLFVGISILSWIELWIDVDLILWTLLGGTHLISMHFF